MKKIFSYLFLFLSTQIVSAQSEITILFTHDLHSAFLGNNGKGGYARLFTIIENERAKNPPSTLLLDAGDIVMGSFFHTLFATESTELRIMGQMGYEYTTLGNHDFDFGIQALADALNIAAQHSPTPPILIANLKATGEPTLQQAMEHYGVREYSIIEKSGKRIGIFGLLGKEAFENAPNAAPLVFEKPIDAARRIVKILREQEKADMVICLSHSGTADKEAYSEDEILAHKVPGIDFIISGHSHTVLPKPIIIKNTIIGSAGAYGEYLGVVRININNEKNLLTHYELIPITDSIPENKTIADTILLFKEKVNEQFLKPFGLRFDDTVTQSHFTLSSDAWINGESGLGNLVADAYLKAAICNDYPAVIGIATEGEIRDSLYKGIIRETDVFNVLSLGAGTDGTPNYPLVLLYLNGKELWDLCELDASISPIIKYAQLFFAGLRYEYNPNRLFCNRVTKVEVRTGDGRYIVPEPEKLYGIAANLYAAQMLGVVKSKTFHILSLVPKTAEGTETADYAAAIMKDPSGKEVKTWLALENYLQQWEEIPDQYSLSEGRKIRTDNKNFMVTISHPNSFAWIVYSIILLIFAGFVYIAIRIIRKAGERKQAKKYTQTQG